VPMKSGRLDGVAGSMVWPARWWNTLVHNRVQKSTYYKKTGRESIVLIACAQYSTTTTYNTGVNAAILSITEFLSVRQGA
jgi:hypothetical protein